MKNYYEILEVDKNASPEVIDKAYKTLVKKYHPDLQEEGKKYESELKIKQINEAYDILSDKGKRELYNKTLNDNYISIDKYNLLINENFKLRNELNNLKNNFNTYTYKNDNYYSNNHTNQNNNNSNINNFNKNNIHKNSYQNYDNEYIKNNKFIEILFSILKRIFSLFCHFLIFLFILFIIYFILKIPFISNAFMGLKPRDFFIILAIVLFFFYNYKK